MARCLGLISVGPEWNREVRLEVFHRDGLVILDFQPLRSVSGNGDDACTEHRGALGFFRAALTHLKKAGVDRLLLELVIDFLGALAFEDHGWQAHWSTPGGKAEIGGVAGYG